MSNLKRFFNNLATCSTILAVNVFILALLGAIVGIFQPGHLVGTILMFGTLVLMFASTITIWQIENPSANS